MKVSLNEMSAISAFVSHNVIALKWVNMSAKDIPQYCAKACSQLRNMSDFIEVAS